MSHTPFPHISEFNSLFPGESSLWEVYDEEHYLEFEQGYTHAHLRFKSRSPSARIPQTTPISCTSHTTPRFSNHLELSRTVSQVRDGAQRHARAGRRRSHMSKWRWAAGYPSNHSRGGEGGGGGWSTRRVFDVYPDTHFSHMSHTPFPHISEFNSLFPVNIPHATHAVFFNVHVADLTRPWPPPPPTHHTPSLFPPTFSRQSPPPTPPHPVCNHLTEEPNDFIIIILLRAGMRSSSATRSSWHGQPPPAWRRGWRRR